MRASRLLAPIIKKQTYDVTELLVNSGYMSKSSSGVYSMLPLGYKIQQNIESIIRNRMNEIDGAECLLPSLALHSIWKKSGRSNNPELFKTNDEKYLLAATCEEEVTSLVSSTIKSNRDLPLRLYQISKKFRNEKRPRGGLLRGKEFIMKDMYSFDKSQAEARKTYQQVQQAYNNLFKDIGVPIVVAEADSGNIGGSLSHEYHYLSSAGEDEVIHCKGCGYTANMEKAVSYGETVESGEAEVKYYISKDHTELIGVYTPPGRVLNNILVDDLVDIDYECKNVIEEWQKQDELIRRMIRIIDPRVGIKCELPEPPVTVNRTGTTTLYEPIVSVNNGENCISCDGTLNNSRAIEVAHTFYLGTKYSSTFNCKVDQSIVEMGCYGIGVSRMVAAIAEVTKDKHGLKWPRSITPFDAVVVATDEKVGLDIVNKLKNVGVSAVWDDRSKQFGALLGAARSFGFPLTVIGGKKYINEGVLEVQRRDNKNAEPLYYPIDNLGELNNLLESYTALE